MPFETVTIAVAGRVFAPVSIAIKVSRDEAARTFDAKIKNATLGQADLVALLAGSPAVTIRASGTLMLTGHVEKRSPRLAATEQELSISGRSKTGDAVDSSHDHPTGEMRNKTAKAMVEEIARPHGISVETDATLATRALARLRPGETVFAFAERLARAEGLTVVDTPEGNLKLAGPPSKRHAGTLNKAMLGPWLSDASAVHDDSKRFAKTKIKAQAPDSYAPPDLTIDAEALDKGGARKRLRVITPPEFLKAEEARKRAKHHRDRSAGNGTKASITVVGWRDPAGTIWTPGWLMPIDIPELGLAQEMMLESATFNQTDADGAGTHAVLEWVDPRAYGGKGGKGAKSKKGWALDGAGAEDS